MYQAQVQGETGLRPFGAPFRAYHALHAMAIVKRKWPLAGGLLLVEELGRAK